MVKPWPQGLERSSEAPTGVMAPNSIAIITPCSYPVNYKRHYAHSQQEPRQNPVRNSFKGFHEAQEVQEQQPAAVIPHWPSRCTRRLAVPKQRAHKDIRGLQVLDYTITHFLQKWKLLSVCLQLGDRSRPKGPALLHLHYWLTHMHVLSSLSKQANRWGFHTANGSCFQK